MALNWTIEVITNFGNSVLVFLLGVIAYRSPKIKKLKSIQYFTLAFLNMGLFFLIESISDLFLIKSLAVISCYFLFPGSILLIGSINYIMKDRFFSYGLILTLSLGPLYIYSGLLPNSINLVERQAYVFYNTNGLFNILSELYLSIAMLYMFYWGYESLKNTPFLIKKETYLFFLGVLVSTILTFIFYIPYYFNRIFLIIANITMTCGLIIIILAIIREPKILYILPFTLHRVLVKDKSGYPLFDHDWAESDVSETIFTGFINAVQKMSKDIIQMGGILDINLKEGILILYELEYISVGLLSTKSSKVLRECVVNFSKDFEEKFERQLKQGIIDIDEYEGAYDLLEKYFSNFPYKFITSKKRKLLLTGKFAKTNPELENKLKEVFPNDQDYNKIKREMQKTPIPIIREFLDLYKTLKKEAEILNESERGILDLNMDEFTNND